MRMIFRHEGRGARWIDIEQPTPEEIHEVARELNIGERIESELIAPTPVPLVAGDSEHALLILHFPTHQEETPNEPKAQEIDFIVGRDFVLTVRYEVIAPLHRLRKVLETEELVGSHVELRPDVFLEVLFAHLFSSIRDYTNHAASVLTRIEKDMFNGQERKTVREISEINRTFLHLHSAVVSHEEPLSRFLLALERRDFFGPAFAERARRILSENEQIGRLVRTHHEAATELRETNSALLNVRQNEIMKTLTVFNFIVLPLELIAFIFGMHVPGTPLTDNPYAFLIIMGVMLVTASVMTLFFAIKRWIF